MIQLKDVLHQLEHPSRDRSGNPVPVHLEAITCNLAEGTGGEVLLLDGVVLAKHARLAGERPPAGRQAAGARAANEFDNGTRNFFIVSSREVRKVHIRLITRFNHEIVVY